MAAGAVALASITALTASTPLRPVPARPAPALARLFTPAAPELGTYDVATTPEPLNRLAPADWRIEAVDPADAFGTAGPYDRSRLTRLYGGTRARVARGWTREGGAFTCFTLISPYPDPSLTYLNAGTMIVRYRVAQD